MHLELHEKCTRKTGHNQCKSVIAPLFSYISHLLQSGLSMRTTWRLRTVCLKYTHGSEQARQASPLYDQQGESCHGQSVIEGLNRCHGLVKSATQTTQCHYGIHLERQTELKCLKHFGSIKFRISMHSSICILNRLNILRVQIFQIHMFRYE